MKSWKNTFIALSIFARGGCTHLATFIVPIAAVNAAVE